jgi:hypothetical protein
VWVSTIAGAPLANWTARLEDVAPDGEVSLVTGGVLNATQARSRTDPGRLVTGERYLLEWDLHFSTWIWRPGHRIRLALSNAQFPMIWPTPFAMTSVVMPEESFVVLPLVPGTSAYPPPVLPAPEMRRHRTDVTRHEAAPAVERSGYEPGTGVTTFEWANNSAWSIGPVRYDYSERELYRTTDSAPAHSSFLGVASHRIRPRDRDFTLKTTIEIVSDSAAFHVVVTRELSDRGRRMRRKTWREVLPREFH